MFTLLFISIAAILNAFMDVLENETFSSSIFKHWNQKFWYKRESWKYAKKIFNYKIDGWHLAKSSMIICIIGAIVNYHVITIWQVDFLLFGLLWNILFEFFYSHVFKN